MTHEQASDLIALAVKWGEADNVEAAFEELISFIDSLLAIERKEGMKQGFNDGRKGMSLLHRAYSEPKYPTISDYEKHLEPKK